MSLRRQGLLFSALAWLALVASPWLPHLEVQAQLLVLSPVILLLGVPHGALDIVFVRQLAGLQTLAGWGLFTGAYLSAAALVVALWWWSPGVFLAAFLLLSGVHFSGDLEGRAPASFRILYGGAVVFCPLALNAAEATQLFAFLTGPAAAQVIVAALQWAASPWVAAIGFAALAGAKRYPVHSIELISIAAVLTLLPPLMGFALFFCGMHSARHVLRTRDYGGTATLLPLVRIAAVPMLFTVAGVVGVGWLAEGRPLDLRLAQLLFVGLAALTVPHMIVVERVRFSGWLLGRNEQESMKGNGHQ